MSELLIETYNKDLEYILESKQLPKGCLGVLKGICADYKDPTRNGRFYSEKLWKKVFEDERIKEGLATKTLFGELDHPADRLESSAKEAAIVMTDYSFDEKAKAVMGEFHILDTPNGRILKSLIEYGSKPGISSRGRGEINEKDSTVAEDSYVFGGFDIVTLPSIKSARPDYELTNESLEVKNFSTSIEKEINDANLDELSKIEKVIGYTELPKETAELLTESIEQKRKSFNTSSSDSTTIADNKLQDDLEEAYKTIDRLESELKESKQKPVEKAKPLKPKQVDDGLDEDLVTDTISNDELYLELAVLRDELSGLYEQQGNLEKTKSMFIEKRRDNEVLQNENETLVNGMEILSEQKETLEENLAHVREKYNRIIVEYGSLKDDHKALRESLKESKNLTQVVEELESEVENLLAVNKKLKDDKITLAEKLDSHTTETTELIEENQNLKDQFNHFANAYIEVRAGQTGLKENAISSLLEENLDVESVENAISQLYTEKARTSNLPFSTDTLISLKERKSEGKGKDDYKNAKIMLGNFKPKKIPEGGNK